MARELGDYDFPPPKTIGGEDDCEECHGTGWVTEQKNPSYPPESVRCRCMYKKDTILHIEKAWRGLILADKVTSSPLDDYLNQNLWVTASLKMFKAYLRRTAIFQGPRWDFAVVSDTDLVSAWLASAILKGAEIYDADVARKSAVPAISLTDLVEPPQVLIIRLGVKSTPNRFAPEVLMEALAHRYHKGKPTWLFDQPHYRLQEGHLCYSPQLDEFLEEDWPHGRLNLSNRKSSSRRVQQQKAYPDLPEENESGSYSLSLSPSKGKSFRTKTVEIPTNEKKNRR